MHFLFLFFGIYKILTFLCNINSIRKKDCLNYKEELRDGLYETPTTSELSERCQNPS